MKQDVGGGLVLRTAVGPEDIARAAAFNGLIHGLELEPVIHSLMTHYPGIDGQDLFLVEDENTGQIVSSLLLIPWTLAYEGVPLPVGEMGMVGTLEAYRRRGLVRVQDAYFKQRLRERGCLLSLIQGIPYFYRQFGYEYALPLEGGLLLNSRDLPRAAHEAVFSFRQASIADLPELICLYKQAAEDLAIGAVRDRQIWTYLFSQNTGALACENWLVEDATGRAMGYFRLPEYHFGEELVVNEVSRLDHDTALAVLRWLKQTAAERKKPGIRLNLPPSCTLMRLAHSLGVHDLGTYAWQVHIPDFAALLRAIGPVLERRLVESPFARLSRSLTLCFYRYSVRLEIAEGKVVEVTLAGPCDGDICFPPLTFIPVLFGYRTVEQMRTVYPDLSVPNADKLLVETLFPLMDSFVYPSY